MAIEGTNGARPSSSIPESGRPETFRPRPRSGTVGRRLEDQDAARETQNQRAVEVLARVKEKLTGKDFRNEEALRVDVQVDKSIREATNLENLCQHYIG